MESKIEIKVLETDEGKVPFEEWYNSLRDKVTKVRVRRRLDRIELGNFGDTESVGEGVYYGRVFSMKNMKNQKNILDIGSYSLKYAAKLTVTITTLITLHTSSASAATFGPALDALKFVVRRQTSIATTFAVAHTAAGTPAAGAGLCGPRFSVTGAAVSCNSSDFFGPHVPPPVVVGNDTAISSAFGTSWLLGFRGIATANASALKGDFAAAGAYARGGAAATAIDGSLAATGLAKASASFSLGGLTIRGSKDPTNSFYGFVVSDQEPTTLNQELIEKSIFGISFDSFISDTLPPELDIGIPDNVFYALFLNLDGATGDLDVLNFGLSVTSPLTNADFEDISTATESAFQLKGSGDFTIDIPFLDLSAPEQVITFDEIRLEVAAAAVPESSSSLAFLTLGTLGVASTLKRKLKLSKARFLNLLS